MLNKETDLQQELSDLSRHNAQLEEQIELMKAREAENQQAVKSAEEQREMMQSQVKLLEAQAEKREQYITGIERDLRQAKEENERIQTDTNQSNKDTLMKIKELERDVLLLNEQNEMLNRSLKEKDICLAQLEKCKNDLHAMLLQDQAQRMVTPNFGD